MNIITFQYTKDDKSTSNRVLAVMVKPNTMYEGLDLSELSEEEQGAASAACTQAYNDYLFALGAVEEQFEALLGLLCCEGVGFCTLFGACGLLGGERCI